MNLLIVKNKNFNLWNDQLGIIVDMIDNFLTNLRFQVNINR